MLYFFVHEIMSKTSISVGFHDSYTKPWYIDFPRRYTGTGKRKRCYYKTKTEAENELKKFLYRIKETGSNGERILSPTEKNDYVDALTILGPYNISIVTAALEYAKKMSTKKEAQVKTLATAYQDFIDSSNFSKSYKSTVRRLMAIFLTKFGDHDFKEISRGDIINWMDDMNFPPGSHDTFLRHLAPFGTWAEKREFIQKSPFKGIDFKRRGKEKPITILNPTQAMSLISACRDLTAELKEEGYIYALDCSDCATAIAVLLFAGVRPKELERLTWQDIHWDTMSLRVGSENSKTGSLRNIEINKTLSTWLRMVPTQLQVGPIIPKNWKRKIQSIRHVCRIGEMADVCRHSYASYHLAYFNDIGILRSNMGHNTRDVLFRHYATMVSKKSAEEYWAISPPV